MKEFDPVNHPKHYNSGSAKCAECGHSIQCIELCRTLNFNLGNVVKYVWRAEHKNGIQDLQKAQWYLNDEINRLLLAESTREGSGVGRGIGQPAPDSIYTPPGAMLLQDSQEC